MSDSSTFITQDTAQLSLDATVVASSNSTTHALSQEEEDRNNNDSHSYPEENQEEERSSEQLDSEPKPEQTLRQRGPQLDHTKPQQKHNNPQASDGYGSLRDVWADQGDFPLVLDKVSHRSISVRGGSRVLLTGANFREGVEVAFECPRLGDSVQSRVIIPRVLKSTEIEFITPNLLDWWAIADKDYSCKQLDLSVTLTCGGVKGQEDVNTSFEMFAVDDSEIELLHMIVELHRQHILMTIKKHGSLETEAERASRQRSLSLLQLSPPQSVSKTEHFALSVIYMHCDTRDEISTEGMNVIKSIVQDGHGMLHLAVLQGQLTLVRELSRHLLAWFQSHPITVNSELFLKNRNGETALDFARSLGNSEIEKVLVETLESAEEFKKSILKTLPQRPPTPPLPTPNHSWPVPGINESPRLYSSSTPSPTMNRPLPPTPLTFPSHEHGFNIRASSYHSISSSSSSIVESPMQYSYPPVHSIQATAINGGYGPESSQAIYENSQSHNNASPGQHHMYPNQHNIPPPHPDPTSAYGVPPSTPLRGNSWSSQHSMQGEQPSPSLPQPTVAPPLPPRHKVTRVTRPKQFIIPQLESLLTQGRLLPQEPYQTIIVQPAPLPSSMPSPYPQQVPIPTQQQQYPPVLPMPSHQPPAPSPSLSSMQMPVSHPPHPQMPTQQQQQYQHQNQHQHQHQHQQQHQDSMTMPVYQPPSPMPVYQPPSPMPVYQPPSPMPTNQHPSPIQMPVPQPTMPSSSSAPMQLHQEQYHQSVSNSRESQSPNLDNQIKVQVQ